MRFVEVMDLSLKFFDAAAFLGPGQFEAPHGGNGVSIDEEEIAEGCETRAKDDKSGPDPFTLANRVNEHPHLEKENNNQPGIAEQYRKKKNQQPMEHVCEASQCNEEWQQSLGAGFQFGPDY